MTARTTTKPPIAEPSELDAIKQDLARMAVAYVNMQDEIERQSKELGAELAQLRAFVQKLRQAHPHRTCADAECALCALLHPRLA